MSEVSTIEAEITDAGGCRRRLSVRIPPEEVTREFEEAVHRFARSVRLPGFRQGKVPPGMVRKRFAHEIADEVREHLVRHGLSEAFQKHNVFPLHNPVLDGGEVKEGEGYSYTALFEVRPQITLGEYKGLKIPMPLPAVTDADVDRALDSLRERMARFEAVEPRQIANGDFVLCDLEGHFEDNKGKDFKHDAVMIEVGAERNLAEFNTALPGMNLDETKAVTVDYPADFGAEHLAGRRVDYKLTPKGIKAKKLPAADDELPRDLGKEGTLAEFKEQIRADLAAAARRAAERQAKETLLRTLIESHPVPVPEVMVEEQINAQVEDMVRDLIMRGIHPSKTDIDWKEAREKETPLATQRVLGTLILDEIASREGLSVSDEELRRKIAEEAHARGEQPGALEKRLSEAGSRQALKNQMVREKSLDFLLENATITP